MATEKLPEGLVPSGSSLTFTEDTIPDALQKEHTLAAGRWGVLHVFAGSVRFVNLETSEESDVSAPDHVIIHPEVPHRVQLTGPVQCRVDFFRELDDDSTMRTPGSFAGDEVRQSFDRCEAAGDFAETFYTTFMNASPAIAPFFAKTEFARQRTLLRDSVYLMVTQDVSDPEMRALLKKLGDTPQPRRPQHRANALRTVAGQHLQNGKSPRPGVDPITRRPLAGTPARGHADHHGRLLEDCAITLLSERCN